jgi:uncharacterized protein involved in outer membrane biogenesis
MAKERERLNSTYNLKFNGGIIETNGTAIILTQVRQYKNLKTINNKNTTITSSRGIIRQNLNIKD